jgi:hypothetical protein
MSGLAMKPLMKTTSSYVVNLSGWHHPVIARDFIEYFEVDLRT